MTDRCRRGILPATLAFAALPGCQRPAAPAPPPKPPEVMVCLPAVRTVADHEEFTGHVEATKAVDIRARVTGYLEKVHFKEGADVEAGALLFTIDERTYKAEFLRAEATVAQAEAHERRLQAEHERSQELLRNKTASKEEADKVAGDWGEAAAAVGVAKASLEVARLNVGFTAVRSPISGRISRQAVDPGNLAKADETMLTSVMALDPVYVYFDVDERTVLRLRRLIQDGKIKSARVSEVRVDVALSDEPGFSPARSGVIDFADNHLEAGTGTLRVRAKVPNPQRLLSPGLFVRVRLPVGTPHEALLVPEQALVSDQGQRFVYVVDDRNRARFRPVKPGALHDGWRVVAAGVQRGDRVVFNGLQRLTPDVETAPKAAEPERPAAADAPRP